jgi:hypothetical protein
VRFLPSGPGNIRFTGPESHSGKKAYIPAPRELKLRGNSTTTTEKEVITTSKKNNKVAGNAAVANDKSAAKDAKKSA